MEIIFDGESLLKKWQRERTPIEVEITVGHVWMTFAGTVAHHSGIELVLANPDGEFSISLFCGSFRVIQPPEDWPEQAPWDRYRRVLQITTDGGASCTLLERRIETTG
jgi:hypothetical protein